MRSLLPASTIMSESFSTISLGIAAGPTRQMKPWTWKATSVTPCSQKVGDVGQLLHARLGRHGDRPAVAGLQDAAAAA